MGKTKTLQILDESMKLNFTQIPNSVIRYDKLSSHAFRLYSILFSYAWYEAECFPGQKRLADDMGKSLSCVQRYLNELKGHGLIDWDVRGLNKTNIYYILPIPQKIKDRYEKTRKNPNPREDGSNLTYPDGSELTDKEYEVKSYEDMYGSKTSLSVVEDRVNGIHFDKECLLVFMYYLAKYREKLGRSHRDLTKRELDMVSSRLSQVYDAYVCLKDHPRVTYADMVDRWFEMKVKTDYNVLHFVSENILENRFHEVTRGWDR